MTDASTTGAVERFACDELGMDRLADGEWVRFTDYQALRERAEAAERHKDAGWDQQRYWCDRYINKTAALEKALVEVMRAEASAWNDAIEAAADVVDSNMLCGYGDSNGDEVLLPRSNPGNKLGFGYSRAIRALRRAAPTEGEAQSLDDTTRAVLDRAERIVAGQSQQEQRTAEIFLRPTEGEA